ncbi:hypothetical protein CI105_06160 [Candidatus Izimaplasma bacterium ZiA1]|uniref:GGDEF domain-containing protein n=1 Tax=Candidatus Izimoplasma sp. ZiA1 TaxID=2024899 RepID=UPI000BAA4239|nr:hypothetical protein CI105_06160 [Candidatus Izimaplasma bacterium ZiA1]
MRRILSIKEGKVFVRSFLYGFLFLFFVLVIFLISEYKGVVSRIHQVIQSDIYTYSFDFDDEIVSISSDLFLLEELTLNYYALYFEDDKTLFTDENSKMDLKEFYVSWMNNKTIYDQIRIIDNDGMELLRVNYNEGVSSPVEEDSLQDKSSRYYFYNSIILDDNFLYISKLDLNVENDEIELVDGKPKPMLRIASTFFDENGNKMGLILVNYLASNLLHTVDELEHSSYADFEVLNKDGYYLHSNNEGIEFGFMYDDLNDEVFSKYHDYKYYEYDNNYVNSDRELKELYTSIVISEESLSQKISQQLGVQTEVVSDNGDIYIVGEVVLFENSEVKDLIVRYSFGFLVVVVLALGIGKIFDEYMANRKQIIRTLEFSSSHDILTGLPNRKSIFDKIEYRLSRKIQMAILFIDFDRFKNVNDTHGHEIGDKVLIEGSKRIKDCLRNDDFIGRIGGDEFVAILNDVDNNKVIDDVCIRIIKAINDINLIDGKKIDIGVSIGVSLSKDFKDVEDLVNYADMAMYEVKKKSKNNYIIFKK